MKFVAFAVAGLAVALMGSSPASAQKKYDTGATDTEVRVGQTMSYSGPISAAAVIGHTMTAYVKKSTKKKEEQTGARLSFCPSMTATIRLGRWRQPVGLWIRRTSCSCSPNLVLQHQQLHKVT